MNDILDVWYNAPEGETLLKSMKEKQEEAEVRSAIIDPYNYGTMSIGTRARPAIIPYQTLRQMAQVPAIAAILLTRQNQVARHTRRPRFAGDVGFEIKLKDRDKKMSAGAKKKAMEIEDFFMRTGGIKNLKRKDNFNTFIRKVVRDTLVLDAMVWENVPNLKDDLSEIWAVDAASIELVANSPVSEAFQLPVYVPMTKRGHATKDIAYVQRINGRIVAEYSEDMLAYAIRNPRTDLEVADFGMSELEMLVEIVTGIMNGVRYNTSYFNHSNLPQGVLEIVGKYKDNHLEGFKRHWKQLTSGASGKWSVPVMALEDGQGFKFTPFKNSNRDMEFNEFLEFLFNIACAVYQIDPNEVGFKSWTSSTSMSQSDNTEAKMENSQDKGFVPLMNFLSDTFNSEVVDRIDPEFEFAWVGVDEEDEDKRNERDIALVGAGIKVVSEVRKERDLEELIDPVTGQEPKWVQAPANATLVQVFMAESGLGQQPGDESDPEGEADQAQAQADDAHQKQLESSGVEHEQNQEASDDEHKKELEKMQMEHEQGKEMEGIKHKNALELEKQKAKNKPKPKPTAQKNKLRKSMEETEEGIEIELTWDKY